MPGIGVKSQRYWIGPGPFELGFGNREQELDWSAYRTLVIAGLRPDLNTCPQKHQRLVLTWLLGP